MPSERNGLQLKFVRAYGCDTDVRFDYTFLAFTY